MLPNIDGKGKVTSNPIENRYAMRTAQVRFPRDGFPVVVNKALENCKYVAGSSITPTHSIRSQRSTADCEWITLLIASAVKTMTTQARMKMKLRATWSFRLNWNENSNSENAVMAIPAVRIWFIVINIT